jgi:hypothetical protein
MYYLDLFQMWPTILVLFQLDSSAIIVRLTEKKIDIEHETAFFLLQIWVAPLYLNSYFNEIYLLH